MIGTGDGNHRKRHPGRPRIDFPRSNDSLKGLPTNRPIQGRTIMGNPAAMRMKKKEKRRKKHELRLATKAAAPATEAKK